jgi:aryl-alcohol dehydrogenase-like predicted oxidoreductase
MDPQDPNCQGLSRHHILHNINRSLKRLQTDYVDILFVHIWDFGTPIEETLSALTDLVRAGKIHYLGASNFKGWQVTIKTFMILSSLIAFNHYKDEDEDHFCA